MLGSSARAVLIRVGQNLNESHKSKQKIRASCLPRHPLDDRGPRCFGCLRGYLHLGRLLYATAGTDRYSAAL
jgi:hypothetical protein